VICHPVARIDIAYLCTKFDDFRFSRSSDMIGHWMNIVIPAKAREYVFTGVGLCVCLSVTTITKKIVDGFVPNFMGRFLGGKGIPSSCFVTIGRGMWK